jgi:hypothetical protein
MTAAAACLITVVQYSLFVEILGWGVCPGRPGHLARDPCRGRKHRPPLSRELDYEKRPVGRFLGAGCPHGPPEGEGVHRAQDAKGGLCKGPGRPGRPLTGHSQSAASPT